MRWEGEDKCGKFNSSVVFASGDFQQTRALLFLLFLFTFTLLLQGQGALPLLVTFFFFSSLSSPPVAGFLLNGVFSFRKEPPDPNAPLPPLPLHLHPPPPPKRASVEEKPDGSGSDELPSACMRTLRNEPESHRCVFAAAGRNQRPNLHHRRRKQLIS